VTPLQIAQRLFKKMPPFVGEDVIHMIEDAVAAARAAGYAEAVKNAAGVALSVMERLNTDYRHEIADAIRALAPATTKEPK
jgi:hypothetical protein